MLTIMVRCQAALPKHMVVLVARLDLQRERTLLPNQTNLVAFLLPRMVRRLYITCVLLSFTSAYRVFHNMWLCFMHLS